MVFFGNANAAQAVKTGLQSKTPAIELVPYFHDNHVNNIGLQPNNLDFYLNDEFIPRHLQEKPVAIPADFEYLVIKTGLWMTNID